MRLVTPEKILFFVLLFLPPEQTFTQSSQPAEGLNFLSAKVSSYDFGKRQMPWLTNHPNLATKVITKSQLPGNEQVSRVYRMTYPTLDIYSSAGADLYFSDSPEANLKVIDALPLGIPEPDLDPRSQVRPSLREALSMIPGIPHSDWATPAQIDYTIFVVSLDRADTNPRQTTAKALQLQNRNASGPKIRLIETPSAHPDLELDAARRNALANQAQEEAIQRLKARLNGSRIRVIEIRLEQ
jgi:hypothetical protein